MLALSGLGEDLDERTGNAPRGGPFGDRPKPAWVSELQGGRSSAGFGVWPAVDPATQQRWVWGPTGGGSKLCWRDEVFGRESSGFGITGSDGHSAGRLERRARTGSVLRNHEALLDAYRPDAPEVAVLFSQGSYQLNWAENGGNAEQACGSTTGWLSLFEGIQLPYAVVDAQRPGGSKVSGSSSWPGRSWCRP